MRAGGGWKISAVAESQPPFIPGLVLNGRFYREAVRPLLAAHFPSLAHSAALIGYGSDVLGLDTPQSRDHNWGPRLQLFVDEQAAAEVSPAITAMLRRWLPTHFAGYPVGYTQPDLADHGTQRMAPAQPGAVNHLVEVTTVTAYFRRYLGVAPDLPLQGVDWLGIPEQKLLEVTAGVVFHDGLGQLNAARARFAYYPRQVWLLRLAAFWQRIGEEEPFLGRTGDVGDDLGSWMLAARLARDLMRLGFAYARRYAPYSKWLGTGSRQLSIGRELAPHLEALSRAHDWRSRERHYLAAVQRLAALHNTIGITRPLSTAVTSFFARPYQVLFADRYAEAIAAEIGDPTLAAARHLGAVDQFTDAVPIASDARTATRLKSIYPLRTASREPPSAPPS